MSTLYVVGSWMHHFAATGKVENIRKETVHAALVELGANPTPNQLVLGSLGNLTAFRRMKGLEAVWGEKFDLYVSWTERYVEEYEALLRKLPEFELTKHKNKGMVQFFCDLTSYAYGYFSEEPFRQRLVKSWESGRDWEIGLPLVQPTVSQAILAITFFPPSFPREAWYFMRNGFSL